MDITLSDLPNIENPYFAVNRVDRYFDNGCFSTGCRNGKTMEIGRGERLTRKQLKEKVADGNILYVDSINKPFSPVVRWVMPDGDPAKGRWELNDSGLWQHWHSSVQFAINRAYAKAPAASCANAATSGREPGPGQGQAGENQAPAPVDPSWAAAGTALAAALAPVAGVQKGPDKAAEPRNAVCELVYQPDQDLVIALTREELARLEENEAAMDEPVRNVFNAGSIEQLRQAKQALSRYIDRWVLVGDGPAACVEIHRLGGQKWSFVSRDLLDSFKKSGRSFRLQNGVPSQGGGVHPQPGPLQPENGRLAKKGLKHGFAAISAKINQEWYIVKPESGRFSIDALIHALAGTPAPAAVVDKLDHWINALERNLQWTFSRNRHARDRILDLLEKQEADRSWWQRLFADDDNSRHYRVFDEDDLGLVRDSVQQIWGQDPGSAAWAAKVQQITFDRLDRRQLAKEIRARPLPESNYSAEARAQLMRYTYGITAAVDFDLPRARLAAGTKAELDLALFQGRAGGRLLLPHARGLNIDIPVIRRDYRSRYEPMESAGTPAPTFGFNQTFPTLKAMGILSAAFDTWHARSGAKLLVHQDGPACKLQLTGHADRPGPEDYNQDLSLRRARVVHGFLTRDPGPWLAMFGIPENHGGWGQNEISAMLAALGHGGSPHKAALAFQHRVNRQRSPDARHLVPNGIIAKDPGSATLAALVQAYMALGNLQNPLKPGHFLNPPCLAAGESQPVVDTPAPCERNRRVTWTIHQLTATDPVVTHKQAPLGALRLDLALTLGGFAGANLLAGAHIHFDINPADATEKERGRLLARGVDSLEAGGQASAFAGARGETGLKAVLQWQSPEPVPPDIQKHNGFVDLASAGYTLIGQAGLGLTGKFQVGFDRESQKFIIKAEASAALGPGYGGKLAFSVGVKHTYNFIAMVYTQLRDNDFSFVDFFEQNEEVNVFDLFCSWSYQMLLKGKLFQAGALGIGAVGAKVVGDVFGMIDFWQQKKEDDDHAEQLIENINKNAEILCYTTPEVKGRILHLLIRRDDFPWFHIDTVFDSWATERKRAVDTVLSWIQSRRHCREVLEHMGVDIPQGDSIREKALRAEQNKRYIIEYLEGLGVSAEQWDRWYGDLPDKAGSSSDGPVKRRRSPADYAS